MRPGSACCLPLGERVAVALCSVLVAPVRFSLPDRIWAGDSPTGWTASQALAPPGPEGVRPGRELQITPERGMTLRKVCEGASLGGLAHWRKERRQGLAQRRPGGLPWPREPFWPAPNGWGGRGRAGRPDRSPTLYTDARRHIGRGLVVP